MSVTEPTASVVIPTWRRRRSLRALLFSVARQTAAKSLQVIVADSQSDDGTAEMIRAFSRRVLPVCHLHTYNALAAKRNLGAAAAKSDIVVFLDDDMRFEDPGALWRLVDDVSRSDAPVCFQVSYPKEWIQKSNYYRFKQWGHARTNAGGREIAPWRFVAMAFGMPLKQYRRLGGFDERYKGYGCEDHAFEAELRREGIQILLSPDAAILHCEDSRSFSGYSEKLISTSQLAMPIFLASCPEGLRGAGYARLESGFFWGAARVLPSSALGFVSMLTAAMMDQLPRKLPLPVLLVASRVFVAAAYLDGMAQRRRA